MFQNKASVPVKFIPAILDIIVGTKAVAIRTAIKPSMRTLDMFFAIHKY